LLSFERTGQAAKTSSQFDVVWLRIFGLFLAAYGLLVFGGSISAQYLDENNNNEVVVGYNYPPVKKIRREENRRIREIGR